MTSSRHASRMSMQAPLRAAVGHRHGLHGAVADALRGSTEDELQADAERLAQDLRQRGFLKHSDSSPGYRTNHTHNYGIR